MTSDDIYALLATKPHNPHYLKRYIKFIFSCTNQPDEYTENHHICPKSPDLFPEYKSFSKNPWNKAVLTARQHFIAHRLLAKAYGNSQIAALKFIITTREIKVSARVYETSRLEHKHFISEKLTGTSRYCYPDGTYYGRISKDDPAIRELNLILQKTEKMTESNRRNQKKAAERNIGTKIYNNGIIQIRRKEHPGEGWTLGMLERSEEHRKNHSESTSKARKNTFVINNGITNIYLKIGEPIPEGYVLGMAPRKKK